MFICEQCREKYEYTHGFMRSYGPCEECGVTNNTLDAQQYKKKTPATGVDKESEGE